MVDIVDRRTRSQMMSGIRSSNTKPELLTRKALHRLGFRYKLGTRINKIKPDIVLRRWNVAIFVHGCYWHQHEGCKLSYSDRKYSYKWRKKFQDNKLRDKRTEEHLLNQGWRIAIIWECVTRDKIKFEKMIAKLNIWLQSGATEYFESDYKKE